MSHTFHTLEDSKTGSEKQRHTISETANKSMRQQDTERINAGISIAKQWKLAHHVKYALQLCRSIRQLFSHSVDVAHEEVQSQYVHTGKGRQIDKLPAQHNLLECLDVFRVD